MTLPADLRPARWATYTRLSDTPTPSEIRVDGPLNPPDASGSSGGFSQLATGVFQLVLCSWCPYDDPIECRANLDLATESGCVVDAIAEFQHSYLLVAAGR